MNYEESIRSKHWAMKRAILNNIPKNNIICWSADNNEQIKNMKTTKTGYGNGQYETKLMTEMGNS